MNNQDNMATTETNNLILILPKNGNLVDSQDNDFKTAVISKFKELQEDMNRWIPRKISWMK